MSAEREASAVLSPVLDVIDGARGRMRVFLLPQATVVVWVAAFVVRPSTATNLSAMTGLVLMFIATAVALLPWEKYPASLLVAAPIVNLIAVACMRAALLPEVPAVEVLSAHSPSGLWRLFFSRGF